MTELERAAFAYVADWCAQCLTCGEEHKPRPHPSGPHYAGTYAHPDDGHLYRSRHIEVAIWLRAQAQERLAGRPDNDTDHGESR